MLWQRKAPRDDESSVPLYLAATATHIAAISENDGSGVSVVAQLPMSTCTVIARNYLAHARVLARSFRAITGASA